MDRLTIPDEPIEGGTRRAVVDARAVKEQALTLYWALKKYEDTGLTPEEIGEIVEKEEPKGVEEVALLYGDGFECKNCGNELSVNEFNGIYCHWCGQKLDWN